MNSNTYMDVLSKATYREFAFRAASVAEAVAWQQRFRPRLRQLLGLDAIAEHAAQQPGARRLASEQLSDHVREEWVLETEAGYWVPFFYLRPLRVRGKIPLVVTPHGHNKRGKADYAGVYDSPEQQREAEANDRDIALQAVRQGYAVVAPDMRGFSGLRRREDIEKDANNSCRTLQMHALLFGRTLIGERVWDVMRLIDWALGQPEVDGDKIAVTGNSGGGTVTLFAAAVDTRIRVAAVGSYFCTFTDSIGSVYHCECNYIPGLLRHAEMYDVAALIAPRPFMAVHGVEDRIYPISGTRFAFERLREAYDVFGAAHRCRLSEGQGGHRYYSRDVWPFIAEQFGEAVGRKPAGDKSR